MNGIKLLKDEAEKPEAVKFNPLFQHGVHMLKM